MSNDFIAIDVETANSSRASICQIGLVEYNGANYVAEWSSLVNPEQDFDGFNIAIHGVTSLDVRGSATFPVAFSQIASKIQGRTVVSHTAFDCDALQSAASRYGLTLPECSWLDTCAVARLTWPGLDNYKLDTLCQHLGITLAHHHALSDAAACGRVLWEAIAQTGLSLQELVLQVGEVETRPTSTRCSPGRIRYSEKIEMRGRSDGPLAGHVFVCTGEFSIGEMTLCSIAADLGCDVRDRFSKKSTTILVVGKRDPAHFNGQLKSRKQLDAEAAIAAGREIAILNETEFLEIAKRYQVRYA